MTQRLYLDHRSVSEVLETFEDCRAIVILMRDVHDELFVVGLEGDVKDTIMSLGEAAIYAARGKHEYTNGH